MCRQSRDGIYEILEYESTLELLDSKGQTAIFSKRLRVKFLQDHVIAFQDHAWGDGDNLGHYTCSPGVIVDRYRDGDRWNILISLRETKNTGDVQEFYIRRAIKRGFMKRFILSLGFAWVCFHRETHRLDRSSHLRL